MSGRGGIYEFNGQKFYGDGREVEIGGGELLDDGRLTEIVKSPQILPDGEPCSHPGCLSHISHPCEGCGRMGGKSVAEAER